MYKDRIKIYKSVKDNKTNEDDKRDYCVYWMQQSQRIHYNHSLEYAIELANQNHLRLVVFFAMSTAGPEANIRHYTFMLEGLEEVAAELEKENIGWVFAEESIEKAILPLMKHAAVLVMDKGYLSMQRHWRSQVVHIAQLEGVSGIYEVESDLIVPVEAASEKEAYAARTIRPKLMRRLRDYTGLFTHHEIKEKWTDEDEKRMAELFPLFKNGGKLFQSGYLEKTLIDCTVSPSKHYKGGYEAARKRLSGFMENGLIHYHESNSPANDYTSKMSLYLHFGQISSTEIYARIMDYCAVNSVPQKAIDSFLEQLIVRRELAFNFCYYRKKYDRFESMTNSWAYETMTKHAGDIRSYIYTLRQLENYSTHDSYWNAAMKEMAVTGYMHNYMRMYWCKKIIEWTPSHEVAYEWSVYLNNKYFIDGSDPNSYVGIAWCFGLHDHGWKEREIFGKLRYMNAAGLERKFDMDAYIKRVDFKEAYDG